MSEDLSPSGGDALIPRLKRPQLLHHTVEQLRKDLHSDELEEPAADDDAFETLRKGVALILAAHERAGSLSAALYRVDLPEKVAYASVAAGGLGELAGAVILRCLQKVVTRSSLR